MVAFGGGKHFLVIVGEMRDSDGKVIYVLA